MTLDWLPKDTLRAVDGLDLKIQVHLVPEIDFLLTKTVLFRGKKFRPTLCFLMGKFVGLSSSVLEPYARAAEFVHAATLAHDDVIDESEQRRNRPTLNARSSNARAVLAGDLLLARVMAELSGLGNIQIIHELAKTVEDLVSGEWLQLEARGIAAINRRHLETVASKKTASLMAWSAGVSLLLQKDWSQAERDKGYAAARSFGESLGIAFQMIDDIIDYDDHGEKPFAQDVREGLVNFVTLEMLEANSDLMGPLQKILGKLEGPHAKGDSIWPWKPLELQEACDRVRSRAHAKLEAAGQILFELSKQVASPDLEALQSLRSVLVYLKERMR